MFFICLSIKTLTSSKDEAYYITPYHSKSGIFDLYPFFFVSDLWYYLSKLIKERASHLQVMLSMLCFHIFGVYLTFMKAVTLILKHATLLRTSNLPKVALTSVDLDFRKQNIDKSIQQYLTAHPSDPSVEQFAGFIMGTEIGWFILLLFVTSISYCPVSVISVLSHCHGHCIDDSVSWNSFWS